MAVPSDLAGELYLAADEIVAFLDHARRGQPLATKRTVEVDTHRVEQMVLNLGQAQGEGIGRIEQSILELFRIQTETLTALTSTNQALQARLASVEAELALLKNAPSAGADALGTRDGILTRKFLLGHYEYTSSGVVIPSAEIYAAYSRWALAQNLEPVNRVWFGRQLKAVFPGIQKVQRTTNDGRPRYFRHLQAIPSEANA